MNRIYTAARPVEVKIFIDGIIRAADRAPGLMQLHGVSLGPGDTACQKWRSGKIGLKSVLQRPVLTARIFRHDQRCIGIVFSRAKFSIAEG